MPSNVAGSTVETAGLLRAVGDSLVLYDGSRLLHCVDPLGPDPAWRELVDLAGDRVVALTSCPDLNGHDVQLFAATAANRLLSWTWPGAATTENPAQGWYAWQPSDLESRPAALAGWSLGPGHQELVLADTAGDLWARRRCDWDSWSPWTLIGVVRDVVALDALASPNGSVELSAVTGDGELKRKARDAAATDADAWGGVEVLAGWPQPALDVACWSQADEAEHQAVLLASGEVQQRWRRAGSREWSPWWSTAAPLPSGVAALAGWSGSDQHQATAVLGTGGHLSLRPWVDEGGWRPWLPAVQITTQLPTVTLSAGRADRNGSDGGDHEPLVGQQPVDRTDPMPNRPAAADPPVTDTARAEEISRAEEATVLFAGRALLPLLPDDPSQIGPFKLQRRIGGGQASTDKFVARNGRGYCFLKVLRPEAADEEAVAFHRESAMAQRVVDRHRLANFIDAHPGDDARPAYLALSFEQGKHLGEVREGRPLASEELLVLARSLLEALVELRECRILHLDIKPSNVIMRNGDYPVVVDYGSAVPAETSEVLEAAFGTPGYAAPEFAGLRAVNPTTDTYSWAAVLISAATGSPPAQDARQRAEQIARLPDQLTELVSAALAEEPVNRPTLDVAVRQLTRTQALGQLGVGVRDRLPVDGLTMIARSEPSPVSLPHLVRRLGELATWQYRVGAAAAAAIGILLGFLVGVFLLQLLRSV